MSPLSVIDAHCHLEPAEFQDRDEVIARARAAGVSHFIVVGAGDTLANVDNALALAAAHPDMSAVIGIHPHQAKLLDDGLLEAIEGHAANNPKVVAIGETGLDYFYDHSTEQQQKDGFSKFIALARRVEKPLVLHVREAHCDARAMFHEEGGLDVGAVVHCFTGTAQDARSWLNLGCYLSFSGIVTFKTADDIRAAALLVPADRILVETDCPFLAPAPKRGKRNEPAWVTHTLQALAKLRQVPVDELAAQTVENTRRCFRLP